MSEVRSLPPRPCSRCGDFEPLFGHNMLCAICRQVEFAAQAAARRDHPANYYKPRPERKRRAFFTVDGRNPDHIAPGEEF